MFKKQENKKNNGKEKKEEKKKKIEFTTGRKRKDPFSLLQTNDRVVFYIPFRCMLNSDTLLLKNGGLAKVFEITNYDLDYQDNINDILDFLNRGLMLLNSAFSIHYETQKTISELEEEKISSFSPIPTILGQKRRNEMFKGKKKFYKIRHFLTISYFYDFDKENSVDDIMNLGRKQDMQKEYKELLDHFNEKIDDVMDLFNNAISDYNLLRDEELIKFLYRTINPLTEQTKYLRKIPYGFPIDEFLSNSQMVIDKGTLKVGDVYTKVLSIKMYPEMVVPQIFAELETLPFPFRSVTRMIGLSKEEASKSITTIERFHYGSRFTLFQTIMNALNTKSQKDNGSETKIRKAFEAKIAREELEDGYVSYGYHTFTLIINDNNLDRLVKKVNLARRIIDKNGFKAIDDKLNVRDAYFGAIPCNIKQNIRRVPMSSEGLRFMLPITSEFQGYDWDERIEARNILTTISEDKIFYYNNKVGDVGHTMVIGPTGAGKSVFLMTEALYFLKYQSKYLDERNQEKVSPSQLFIFDKGGSSKALTINTGGTFYNLGSEENVPMQPLRYIHRKRDLEFARDWLQGIIEQEDPSLVKDIKKMEEIWQALIRLSTMPEDDRTITTFVRLVQDSQLKAVLNIYSKSGTFGDYFDGNKDQFSNANIITFEMENIMEKPKVLNPMLEYLFFRINERLQQGIATRVILDECWVFLKNERMKGKIEEWLKVFRKQNASLVFATQSIQDVESSSIASSIKDACMTKIFLPNVNAEQAGYYEIYKNYGLSDLTIEEIASAIPKREYVYTSPYGIRKFALNLSRLELVYVAASDDITKTLIGNLEKLYQEKWKEDKVNYLKEINLAYLQHKKQDGLINEDDYIFAKNVIEEN